MRNESGLSAPASKWEARLRKDREKLFTFLTRDGVSWNNNNAEHAIKAFARLRRTIEGLSTPKGIEEYLILLSVCQTCKYSGLDFLGFLRSGETDISTFAASQRNRSGLIVLLRTQSRIHDKSMRSSTRNLHWHRSGPASRGSSTASTPMGWMPTRWSAAVARSGSRGL